MRPPDSQSRSGWGPSGRPGAVYLVRTGAPASRAPPPSYIPGPPARRTWPPGSAGSWAHPPSCPRLLRHPASHASGRCPRRSAPGPPRSPQWPDSGGTSTAPPPAPWRGSPGRRNTPQRCPVTVPYRGRPSAPATHSPGQSGGLSRRRVKTDSNSQSSCAPLPLPRSRSETGTATGK